MEAFASMKADFAATAIEAIFNGPLGHKVEWLEGGHTWTMGVAVDDSTGEEMFQIQVRDTLLVPAKD